MTKMIWSRGEFLVSDDKSLLKVPQVAGLMRQGYWCKHYDAEKIARLIEKSFWLGVYLRDELVGFARVVTDKETVTMITDFVVDEKHRKTGHGAWLMACLLEHPELKDTSFSLGTQDADNFFEKFGFTREGSQMHRAPNAPPPPPPPPL
jgi:GNAT superfamily N-acetyltransferase